MLATGTISWMMFLAISSLVLLIFMLLGGRQNRLDVRLRDLSGDGTSPEGQEMVGQLALSALPKMGSLMAPDNEDQRTHLQARLIHAGFYGRQAMYIFLGVKMLLMLCFPLLGLLAAFSGLVSLQWGVMVGGLLGICGMLAPSFWLNHRKAQRQLSFRRALPDALDVLVICLEGGLSLPASLRRVSSELRAAHPLLAAELGIVQRSTQFSRSTGEALREFGDRADLMEVRSLASVIIQAERFGASLTKSLRVHAETLRTKRLLQAEEKAQRAAIKILFPTMLCIFPGMFVVILLPAGIRVAEMLTSFKD